VPVSPIITTLISDEESLAAAAIIRCLKENAGCVEYYMAFYKSLKG
jgi:hypothetical protein